MSRDPQIVVGGDTTPVDHALDQLVAGLDHLLEVLGDGGLDHFDDLALVGFAQAFERFRNRLSLVDHRIVAEAGARHLAQVWTQPSTARLLVSALRISAAEARRRVAAAEAVGPRVSVTGEVLAAHRPVLAAAQQAGQVSAEQVQVIVRALAEVDRRGFDPADLAAGEQILTGQAKVFEPKVLAQLAERVVAGIDPDGTVPDDTLNADRRHFSLRPTRDGAYTGEFRLTGVAGAKLAAVLGPLAKPRVTTTDPDTDTGDSRVGLVCADERTYGQRMHDAVEDVCDRLLRSGRLPDAGGVPATVIVTIGVDDLLSRTGTGRTSDGTRLSAGQVLELAAEAEIIPTVLARSGAVLSQGRARRLATPAQTWALIARDTGCSFPGCDRAPELCERHHVIAWIDGGRTDLDNLTLLCRYHHHQFAGRGWTATINPDGLPEWTPPAWIDRQRQPRINTLIQLTRLTRLGRPAQQNHRSREREGGNRSGRDPAGLAPVG